MNCFRVTRERDSAKAFDGNGASTYPGRWNERNERAVYLTTRLPLGVLEVMVQDSVTNLAGYGFYPVTIPDDLTLSKFDHTVLSPTWRTAREGRIECRAIGDTLRASKASIGFIVPSAVIPEAFPFGDFNIVLDPTHIDANRLVIEPWQPLEVDPRIQTLFAKPSP